MHCMGKKFSYESAFKCCARRMQVGRHIDGTIFLYHHFVKDVRSAFTRMSKASKSSMASSSAAPRFFSLLLVLGRRNHSLSLSLSVVVVDCCTGLFCYFRLHPQHKMMMDHHRQYLLRLYLCQFFHHRWEIRRETLRHFAISPSFTGASASSYSDFLLLHLSFLLW